MQGVEARIVDKRGTDPKLYDASNPEDVEAYLFALQVESAAQILRKAQDEQLQKERELRAYQNRELVRYNFIHDFGIDPSPGTLDDLVRRDHDSTDYSGW
ncbi:hypothetical protein KA078_01705 [Candidatus Woesebacteria bacterium]|nr:hypothetical protein [Candidatus Woesebacteria bacterium]